MPRKNLTAITPATKRQKRKVEAAPELPEWVNERTPTTDYTLEATSDHGIDQAVEMTLEEFEALKEHLCKLRGYKVPAEEAAHA
jgi:hypothetical protein